MRLHGVFSKCSHSFSVPLILREPAKPGVSSRPSEGMFL